MVDNSKEVRKQILNVIGGLAAAITIITYLVLCIDSAWSFIDKASFIYNVLIVIKTWAPLLVVAIVGWEFVADKKLIVRIIYYIAIALVVISMFFPSTWTEFVGVVDRAANK